MPPRKRRARGEGTIRLRRDGRWEGRLSLPDGRRKSVFARTQREAVEKLRRLQQDIAQGQLPAAGRPPTLAAFLETWLVDVGHRCGPRTHRSYADVVRLHLRPALGTVPLDLRHLTPARIQALLHAKQAAGLSPRTVTYIRDVLSRALNVAVRWGWLPRNPAPLAAVPRQVRRPVPVLTPAQARGLLAAARAPDQPPYLAAFLSLLLGLGLRRGEALGLSWSDIDVAAGTVRITAQLGRVLGVGLVRRPPKSTAALRTLPLPPVVAAELAAWQRRQAAARLAAGPAWQAVPWQPVFTTALGTPLDERAVHRAFKRLLDQAGPALGLSPTLRLHDLRHACATLLLAEGTPLKLIQELLGHASAHLTLSTYSHVLPQLTRDAARRMHALLTDPTPTPTD
jgi:integrase